MSGIYIPDVGLPQDGDFELWIAIKKDGSFTYNVSGKWRDGKQKAVPVPPHGDLIERNKANFTDFEIVMCNGDYKEGMKMLLEKIESAPTIIPASEEGE